MSIWSSIDIGEPEVMALNNDTEAANYRGEGEPNVYIDVATTWHPLARLSISSDDADLAEVLIGSDAIRLLIDRLQKALPLLEKQEAER